MSITKYLAWNSKHLLLISVQAHKLLRGGEKVRIFDSLDEKSAEFQWSLERKVRNSEPLYRARKHINDFKAEEVRIFNAVGEKSPDFQWSLERKSPEFRTPL